MSQSPLDVGPLSLRKNTIEVRCEGVERSVPVLVPVNRGCDCEADRTRIAWLRSYSTSVSCSFTGREGTLWLEQRIVKH